MDIVSTLAQRNVTLAGIARSQRLAADAGLSTSTGQLADVGKSLGGACAGLVQLRQAASDIAAIGQSNAVVTSRLDLTQSALATIGSIADNFFSAATAMQQGSGDRSVLVATARSSLDQLVSVLGTTGNGGYIFGGINAGEAPVGNYLADPPGAGRSAVQGAFGREFGIAPGDAAARDITPAQMTSYLQGAFSRLFGDPGWTTSFSSASDTVPRDRIAPGEEIGGSVSANDPAIRKLFASLVAVVDGGAEQLSADTFSALVDHASSLAGSAKSDLVATRSSVGLAQERLAQASQRISWQSDWLNKRIAEQTSVDAATAASQLNAATTQLQASYAVTARMQQMSLLNYL